MTGRQSPVAGLGQGQTGLISAIVVSWNTRDLLADCLRNLCAQRLSGHEIEIIVVDNGSTDGTADMVREDFRDARLIVNEENLGFTRANNQAIRASSGELLLLINSDARLEPRCLELLVGSLDEDERAGVVGPRLVYGDGRWQRWTAGSAPTLRSAICHYLFLDRLFPRASLFRGLFLAHDTHELFQPDWVCSACMLVRRDALDRVGLLDERLFVYMDDVELCERMRAGGWHVWYRPDAQAVHYGGQSLAQRPSRASTVPLRAFTAYFARERGPRAAIVLKAILAVGSALRVLLYGARAALNRRDFRARGQAQAHGTFLKVALEPGVGRGATEV